MLQYKGDIKKTNNNKCFHWIEEKKITRTNYLVYVLDSWVLFFRTICALCVLCYEFNIWWIKNQRSSLFNTLTWNTCSNGFYLSFIELHHIAEVFLFRLLFFIFHLLLSFFLLSDMLYRSISRISCFQAFC